MGGSNAKPRSSAKALVQDRAESTAAAGATKHRTWGARPTGGRPQRAPFRPGAPGTKRRGRIASTKTTPSWGGERNRRKSQLRRVDSQVLVSVSEVRRKSQKLGAVAHPCMNRRHGECGIKRVRHICLSKVDRIIDPAGLEGVNKANFPRGRNVLLRDGEPRGYLVRLQGIRCRADWRGNPPPLNFTDRQVPELSSEWRPVGTFQSA